MTLFGSSRVISTSHSTVPVNAATGLATQFERSASILRASRRNDEYLPGATFNVIVRRVPVVLETEECKPNTVVSDNRAVVLQVMGLIACTTLVSLRTRGEDGG
jgi:hypothetical protein